MKIAEKEELKNYIETFLKKQDEELVCTSRVLDTLATEIIDSGNTDLQAEAEKLLSKESVMEYIREHIPYTAKVPFEVKNNVQSYFEEHLKNYTPVEICRISNHPEDHYLYAVIARHNNGDYACWTSWNHSTESMNFGHYGLSDREAAFSIVQDKFNDISGEIEKYGPEKTVTAMDSSCNTKDIREDASLEHCAQRKRHRR